MAEEESLLQLNADDKAEDSEHRKASQQMDLFVVAFVILKVSMLCEHQEAPAEMVLSTGHGHVERWVPTQPWGDSPVLTYTGSSWTQLMHEPFCSRLGWEALQTGNVQEN